MAKIQTGASTPGAANVDATFALVVNPLLEEDEAGFVTIAHENDDGTVVTKEVKLPKVSQDCRLQIGFDSMLFNLSFEGTIISRAHIQQNLTTMTVAQATGFLTLNNGASVTDTEAANIRTYRTFPVFGTFTTYVDMWITEANITSTNSVSEWGFGYATGVAAPTDGVFFRRSAGGALTGVANYAGSEGTPVTITTTNVPSRDGAGSFDATECNHYRVSVHNNKVQFWINGSLVGSITSVATSPLPCASQTQPVFARVYNSGTASAARKVSIGFLTVIQGDLNCSKPWGHQICGSGGGAYQVQPGTTSDQTANYANSAAPSDVGAALSNTTNGGYTTLGGQWRWDDVATNETDFILFGYTNPAGSATLPGKTLYVTGIRIGETTNTAAAVAATAGGVQIFWAAACAGTTTSLATSDAATTVKARRVALGTQSFAASAVQGTTIAGFFVDFSQAPLVTPPGSIFYISPKTLGQANTGCIWRGTVLVIGYFE